MAELMTIGTLTLAQRGWTWPLRYATCGHGQAFPRDAALADLEAAEREVRRHSATCLTCQVDQRRLERSRGPALKHTPAR